MTLLFKYSDFGLYLYKNKTNKMGSNRNYPSIVYLKKRVFFEWIARFKCSTLSLV